MTTTIKDFCIANNIEWFPIYLELVEGKNGKIEKKLSAINHPAYDGLPKQTDFGTLSKEQLAERQSILQYSIYNHVKHIAMDTRKIYHIDIDVPEYDEIFDLVADLTPYFKSTTKSYGKHILIKSDTFVPTSKRHQFKSKGVELLCGQWSYAPIDGEMFNDDCPIQEHNHLLENKLDIIKESLPTTTSKTPALTDDQIKHNTLNDLEKFKVMSQCYSKERLSNYDTYFKLTMAIKNSFGDLGKPVWEEICSRGDNYDSNKNNEQWYKYSPKTKEEKLLKFGTLIKWAKDDDPVKYEQLFGKKINWDLSEAEFAKALKRVCFDDRHVLFTGKGKEPEGYLYNGVYWTELSLHNAELKQNHFDNLYKFYKNALEKEKPNLEEDVYKSLMAQVKTLNTNKTRTNILKIFQADNYVADVKWNENKHLFVFENCVYDLEKGAFVTSNPDDYINTSCGYKFDDSNNAELEKAKSKIKDFVDSILLESDREYVWTLLGSSVVQSNEEEKAYFLLGIGRNGKGTLIKPFKNSLGKYWGDLNMNYYTTHDKGADTPNQNLYNCRNSRVVSSVEVSDSDSQNRAVKFVSDKFKTISGNDTIYARELGTKNSAYFQAGKPFIQTNVMPVFTKLDTSLKERIIVINFPYTFKETPVEPNEKPINTSLKAEFDKEIYKTAMISLLFQYYKKYKEEGLIIPESVKSYTKTYFASSSVQQWIDDNLEPTTKGGIDLKEILTLYEEASDKKMTVKQLKTELEDLKYVVKRGVSTFVLKNWKLKAKEDNENSENIDTENIELIEE